MSYPFEVLMHHKAHCPQQTKNKQELGKEIHRLVEPYGRKLSFKTHQPKAIIKN